MPSSNPPNAGITPKMRAAARSAPRSSHSTTIRVERSSMVSRNRNRRGRTRATSAFSLENHPRLFRQHKKAVVARTGPTVPSSSTYIPDDARCTDALVVRLASR